MLSPPVMRRHVVDLGYNRHTKRKLPKDLSYTSLRNKRLRLLPEDIPRKDCRTWSEYYRNRRGVYLIIERTSYLRSRVESLIFLEKGIQAGVAYTADRTNKETPIIHSNRKGLERSIRDALSELPEKAPREEFLKTIYLQLVGYVGKTHKRSC